MKAIVILGVALIVMGAAVLGYDHYSYTTTENILQIGQSRRPPNGRIRFHCLRLSAGC